MAAVVEGGIAFFAGVPVPSRIVRVNNVNVHSKADIFGQVEQVPLGENVHFVFSVPTQRFGGY